MWLILLIVHLGFCYASSCCTSRPKPPCVNLDDLCDVTITAFPPANGSVLTYSSTLNAWTNGAPCNCSGTIGPQGPPGPPGANGTEGPPGPPGPPGSNSGFAQLTRNLPSAPIAVEAPIVFDLINANSGVITYSVVTGQSTINTAGLYRIDWLLTANEPNQFSVFVNSFPLGSFGSGAGTQTNAGLYFIQLAVGDKITLVNHSSPAAVTLQTFAGGTQANILATMSFQLLLAT